MNECDFYYYDWELFPPRVREELYKLLKHISPPYIGTPIRLERYVAYIRKFKIHSKTANEYEIQLVAFFEEWRQKYPGIADVSVVHFLVKPYAGWKSLTEFMEGNE